MTTSPEYPIVVSNLTKRYGQVMAVEDLSFTVTPGRVTGFLGPNGAGKTTTLRVLLGLDNPDSGTALIGDKRYRDFASPGTLVGASLDADSFHPGRTGRNHLRIYATAMGVPGSRIDAVLNLVGLTGAADRAVRGYSLGMRQRLGLATGMLADPRVLVMDEPANGLDPEGIRWMRGFLRSLAGEGRTILLSSHLLGEIQLIAQDLVIINHGRLVAAGDLQSIEAAADKTVLVDAPDRENLWNVLAQAKLELSSAEKGIVVRGATAEQVGAIALDARLPLSHLSVTTAGLEETFLGLVGGVR